MKQLRYFTRHPDSLDEAKKMLARVGVKRDSVHVFAKDNTQHRFDGLLLQSELSEDNHLSRVSMWSVSMLALAGCYAIAVEWVNFLQFALICFVVTGVLVWLARATQKTVDKSVYFLVVEVDDALASQVKTSLDTLYQVVPA